jgi:hypothetical protein
MMKLSLSNIKRIAIAILIMLLPLPLWYTVIKIKRTVSERYFNEVKKNPRVFCFDTLGNTLNNAYYIDDVLYKDAFVKYYNESINGANVAFSFPIKTMTYKKPLILLDYLPPDSALVKVVDFDTICWGYIEGYVHRISVSNRPPSAERIKEKDDFIKEYTQTDEYKMRSKSYKPGNRISKYGIQCSCEF